MNRCLAAFLALLVVSLDVSSPCFAGPNGEASLLVHYDDLDLSTPEGVKALNHRLERAADEACLNASGPAQSQQLDLGCSADARAAARAQLPRLIAKQLLSKSSAVAATEHR